MTPSCFQASTWKVFWIMRPKSRRSSTREVEVLKFRRLLPISSKLSTCNENSRIVGFLLLILKLMSPSRPQSYRLASHIGPGLEKPGLTTFFWSFLIWNLHILAGGFNIFHTIGKSKGVYLIGLYLFTKLLYVLNVLFQFVLLNEFLGPQYTFWGFGILQDIMNGREWSESGHFPRVTLCDFNVRVLGNIHRWTVQCVLMINMFNEKIFVFLWFWFLFVGIMSILSLIYWLLATTLGGGRKEFVTKYLRCTSAVSEEPTPREQELIDGFVNNLLRPDGVFLLRLIQTNGGDLLVGEIVTALFNRYVAKFTENGKPGSRAVTESPNSTNL